MPTLVNSYLTTNGGGFDTATLTSPTFTPAIGEVIVVKAIHGDGGGVGGTPTDTQGNTYTFRASGTNSSGSSTWTGIWTATTGAATSMSVSVTWSGSTAAHSTMVERWSNARLAASPVTKAAASLSGLPATTLTTTGASSAVSWLNGDYSCQSPVGRGYVSSSSTPTEEGIDDQSALGVALGYVAYYVRQVASSIGSQNLGMTAPLAQSWDLLAIEILDASSAFSYEPREYWPGKGPRRHVGTQFNPTYFSTDSAPAPVVPSFVPGMRFARSQPKLLRRPSLAASEPVSMQAPVITQAMTRRLGRALGWNRRHAVTWAPLPGQDGRPGAITRRRFATAPRRPRAFGPLSVQQTVVTNPSITATVFGRLRSIGRVRASARINPPTPPQFNPPIVSTVIGRLRSVGRVRRAGRVTPPTPPQFNPPIVSTVIGRLRSVGRIRRSWRIDQPAPLQSIPMPVRRYRPPGRLLSRVKGANPTPTQQAAVINPSITATVFGRLRLVGRVRPPARVVKPTPSQVNPPIVQTVNGRLRSIGRIQARSRAAAGAPVQQLTPNPFAVRRLRFRRAQSSRARVSSPTLTQQSTIPNPGITATVFGRLRSVGRIQPRSKVTGVPVQQSTPNPFTVRVFGRLRSIGRVNRTPRIVKPIPAQVNPPYPVRPSRVLALRGMSRRRGGPKSVPQVQPTAEIRTSPVSGLRGLRRLWLKVRRKNAMPIPGQVTTLQGPLVITDSHGGVETDRGAGMSISGVYGSSGSSTISKGSAGAFTADPDNDNVVGKYDSDSDSL